MARELIIRPAAESDLADAFAWYEDHETGLGFRCLDAVEKTFQSICFNSEQFEVVHKDYRRALVKRFPYAVFFRDEGSIVVYAVLHTTRRPSRWRHRLN